LKLFEKNFSPLLYSDLLTFNTIKEVISLSVLLILGKSCGKIIFFVFILSLY